MYMPLCIDIVTSTSRYLSISLYSNNVVSTLRNVEITISRDVVLLQCPYIDIIT